MIRVERGRVPRPPVLDSPRVEKERQSAVEFYRDGRPGQERFNFTSYKATEIRLALTELFYGKCAYCEVKIVASSIPDIELFRPKAGVTESPGHPGYWWLVSDWDNMLISCPNCNRVRTEAGERTGKGNRFPLADERQRAFGPGEEEKELPLLLDPCRDFPEEHLVFDETGRVVSDTEQGQTTISVLGLNRTGLVEARRQAAVYVKGIVAAIDASLARPLDQGRGVVLDGEIDQLMAVIGPDQEFAGLKRQLARPTIDRLTRKGHVDSSPQSATPTISKSRKATAKASFRQHQVDQSSFSLADQKGRETYRSERRLIQRVVIHNVKAIRDLELDLTDPGIGQTPWLMLLGENGTGKSTVLQTIALTLVGAAGMARLVESGAVRPADYVRYRCKSGTVSVQMTGFVGPHRLTFRPDRVEFTSPTGEVTTVAAGPGRPGVKPAGWDPQTVLLGYGATRLLPHVTERVRSEVGDRFSRVDNLFDPFVPLIDAELWLTTREGVEFDSAALALKDLLSLEADARLEVEDGRVVVFQHGDKVPLRMLSDGYQSVVATAIDIFEVVTRLWPNLESAEGIVLLDELGAHLHPAWKMKIVGSVRKALPGVQFITSTHDPLCLRGLSAGEVVVMQRDESDRVHALTGLPSPGDFRVDQLLTSDFFGLDSTIDPETDALFDEYYALLALREPNSDQAQRLATLQGQLRDRRYMGTTMRESLMYEAVDRIVARHKVAPVRTIPDLTQEAIDEIGRIWAETEPAPVSP
jgi:uncharacterized protein (TIGR02646 family)